MGISNDIAPKKVFHVQENRGATQPKIEKVEPDFDIPIQTESQSEIKIEQEVATEEDIKEEKKAENSNIQADSFFPENKSITKKAEKTKKNISKIKINPIWFLWSLFLVLLVILAFQNRDHIRNLISKNNNAKTETSQNTNNEEDTVYTSESDTTDNSVDNNTNINIKDTAPSSETTTPATTTPTIDKSAIKISVLNGNGVTNSANAIEKVLENNGFTISNTGNAKKFTYTQTYIYYKTGKDAEANLIKGALSQRSVVLEKSDTTVGNYDCVVVVGKK